MLNFSFLNSSSHLWTYSAILYYASSPKFCSLMNYPSADLIRLPNAITQAKNTPELIIDKGININLLAWKAEIAPMPNPAKHPMANPCSPPYRKNVFFIFKSSLKALNFLENLLDRSLAIKFLARLSFFTNF